VIRRGFWLAVGAAGGIFGYRRVSSLARQVSQTLGTRPPGQNRPNGFAPMKRHWARETIRFARDVREGMDLYSARHPRHGRPTLGASTGSASTSSASTSNATNRDDERVKDDR
jgi:hypothetical protein